MNYSKLFFLALTMIGVGEAHAQWSLTGNTPSPTQFLGTTDGSSLIFKTSNVQAMQINPAGQVGIGTAAPRGVFDINKWGDVYLTPNPNGGVNASDNHVFLSGHVYLAPYGNSNISYLQARRWNNQGTVEMRLRTYDNGNLYEAMHLAGNGYVGVGTVWPKARLHIAPTVLPTWRDAMPDDALLMVGGHNNLIAGQCINFKNPAADDGFQGMWKWSADVLFGRYGNDAKIAFKENHGAPYGTNVKDIFVAHLVDNGGYTNLDKVILAPETGNVGIGTRNPSDKLSVAGNVMVQGFNNVVQIHDRITLQTTNTSDNGWTRGLLGHNVKWDPTKNKWVAGGGQYNDFSMVRFESGGTIGFYTRHIEPGNDEITDAQMQTKRRMYIGYDGGVGIGTDNAYGYKLAVEGDAIFTKIVVKVRSNWADYVFNKDYRLLPLQDLEQYIKQHSHLPDVPSAAEVEEKGLDVGGNQAVLLKKIEELTLYIIEQNKDIRSMQERIDSLEQGKKKSRKNK